jgi:GntR family transcriptional regulator/MocR family aminotransferase
MHLVLRLQGQRSDRQLVARMLAEGLYGEALTDWTAQGDGPPAVLVNFTNIDSQRTAERHATRILELVRGSR